MGKFKNYSDRRKSDSTKIKPSSVIPETETAFLKSSKGIISALLGMYNTVNCLRVILESLY